MTDHNHPKPAPKCQHKGTLEYCSKCDVVYCTKCGDEFSRPQTRTPNFKDMYDREWNKPDTRPRPFLPDGGIMLCCHKNTN
jgi:hypothetical protein